MNAIKPTYRTTTAGASGFTLIEVLVALTIIAIALTALIKSSAQSINNAQRLKEKTISHLVAMQGAAMLELGLLEPNPRQDLTQVTTIFGQRWYWRVNMQATPITGIYQLTIKTSKKQTGPFLDPLVTFYYAKKTINQS